MTKSMSGPAVLRVIFSFGQERRLSILGFHEESVAFGGNSEAIKLALLPDSRIKVIVLDFQH